MWALLIALVALTVRHPDDDPGNETAPAGPGDRAGNGEG
jgi:hypothetical protein